MPHISKNYTGQNLLMQVIVDGKNSDSSDYQSHIIETLCETEGYDINAKDIFGNTTPLHMASQLNNLRAVELLLQHNVPVDCLNHNNNTALSEAVFHNRLNVVEFLLNKGANPNHLGNQNLSILSMAVNKDVITSQNMEIFKLLLTAKADVNVIIEHNQTVLHTAALLGHHEMVEALLKLVKQNLVDHKDVQGMRALDMAIYSNHHKIIGSLWKNGAQFRLEDIKTVFSKVENAQQIPQVLDDIQLSDFVKKIHNIFVNFAKNNDNEKVKFREDVEKVDFRSLEALELVNSAISDYPNSRLLGEKFYKSLDNINDRQDLCHTLLSFNGMWETYENFNTIGLDVDSNCIVTDLVGDFQFLS